MVGDGLTTKYYTKSHYYPFEYSLLVLQYFFSATMRPTAAAPSAATVATRLRLLPSFFTTKNNYSTTNTTNSYYHKHNNRCYCYCCKLLLLLPTCLPYPQPFAHQGASSNGRCQLGMSGKPRFEAMRGWA